MALTHSNFSFLPPDFPKADLLLSDLLTGVSCYGDLVVGAQAPSPPFPLSELQQLSSGSQVRVISQLLASTTRDWSSGVVSPALRRFLVQQSDISGMQTDALLLREMEQGISKRMNYFFRDAPLAETTGKATFFFSKSRSQHQAVLNLESDHFFQVVLDPNKLNCLIVAVSPSPDGEYLAYVSIDFSGVQRLRVIETATGISIVDRVAASKFAVVWNEAGTGFYFLRCADENSLVAGTVNQLCYQSINSSEFEVIYYSDSATLHSVSLTKDGKYLIVALTNCSGNNVTVVKDLSCPVAQWNELITSVNQPASNPVSYRFVGNNRNQLFFLTDDQAENFKLVSVDADAPTKVETVIAESPNLVLAEVVCVSTFRQLNFVVSGYSNGVSVLQVYGEQGRFARQVDLPSYGFVQNLLPCGVDQVTFAFSGPVFPNHVFALNVSSCHVETVWQPGPEMTFDKEEFCAVQMFVDYADRFGSVRLMPIYIFHRSDIVYDGKCFVKIDLGGGFGEPLMLGYSSARAEWLDRLGVLIIPGLPGCGDLGSESRRLGAQENKVNTYIATESIVRAVQDLNLASSDLIGISGTGSGATTIAAVLNRSPELFGAVAIDSPITSLYSEIEGGFEDEFGCKSERDCWSDLDVLSNICPSKRYPDTLVRVDLYNPQVSASNGIAYASLRQSIPGDNAQLLCTGLTRLEKRLSASLFDAFLWRTLAMRSRSLFQ